MWLILNGPIDETSRAQYQRENFKRRLIYSARLIWRDMIFSNILSWFVAQMSPFVIDSFDG